MTHFREKGMREIRVTFCHSFQLLQPKICTVPKYHIWSWRVLSLITITGNCLHAHSTFFTETEEFNSGYLGEEEGGGREGRKKKGIKQNSNRPIPADFYTIRKTK